MERLKRRRSRRVTETQLEIMSRLHRAKGRLNFLRSVNEDDYKVWLDDSNKGIIGLVLDQKELKKAPRLVKEAFSTESLDSIEQAYAEIVLPEPSSRGKFVELNIQSLESLSLHILSPEATWIISRMYKRKKPSETI